MPEFLQLTSPKEALQKLLTNLEARNPESEILETRLALGRVTAEDIIASHPLPEFPRSTVDGYAVYGQDTFGCSESLPGYLTLVGEVLMGKKSSILLTPGFCTLIHTGGMLPDGANAVIMLEDTQTVQSRKERNSYSQEVEIRHAVTEGENVLQVGEDVEKGEIVIRAGTKVRPVEIGGCMALGIVKMRVAIKPMIGIISTGDEVIHPEKKPRIGQVRDINSYSLAALIDSAGGNPIIYGVVSDNLEQLKSAAKKAISECDAIVITAGSSASSRDTTAEAIAHLGEPGVLVHGINIRPGKPTILSVCAGKAVIGLPGNPVSALVIASLFVVPLIEYLLGLRLTHPHSTVLAKLNINVSSQAGREDWIAVKLAPISRNHQDSSRNQGEEEINWIAEPIFSKSNLIFSLVKSDGLICIPLERTGISAGEIVEVSII